MAYTFHIRKAKTMRKTTLIIIAIVLIVLIVAGAFAGVYLSKHTTPSTASSNGVTAPE